MRLIALALLALIAFVVVWIFVVAPAERRHHERRLAAIRKRIENRETARQRDEPDEDNGG